MANAYQKFKRELRQAQQMLQAQDVPLTNRQGKIHEDITADDIAEVEAIIEQAGYKTVDPETRQPRKKHSKKVH